jgi:uncharacterized protein YndB with AHSA1/START domain
MMTTQNELKVSLPNDTEVLWERSFDAPRALVFDVLTNPKHLPKWMAGEESGAQPGDIGYGYKMEATADLRNGGSYRNFFHGGPGPDFALYGEFQELSPPDRIVFTENMEGIDGPPSVNVVKLEERDGRTYLTMVTTFVSKEQRDAVVATGMAEGAAQSYNQMDAYLKTLS